MQIATAQIEEWNEIIQQSRHLIDNLKQQRDKVYAQEDADNDIENIVSLTDIKRLLGIARAIITKIQDIHYQQAIVFDMINSPVISLKYNIERLAEEKKQVMEKYRPLARKYGLEDELPPAL